MRRSSKRSPDDLPPWWSPKRATIGGTIALAAVSIVASTGAVLGRRVDLRTVLVVLGAVITVAVVCPRSLRLARRRRSERLAAAGCPPWEHDRVWSPAGDARPPWRRAVPGPPRGANVLIFLAGMIAGFAAHAGAGPLVLTLAALPHSILAVLLYRAFHQGGIQIRWPSFPIRPGGRVVFHIATTAGGSRLTDTVVALRCHGPLGKFDAWDHYPVRVVHLPDERSPGPDEFVEVAFDIPADAPSNDLLAKRPTRWELVVAGDTPWGEVVEVFTVPVYRDEPPPLAPAA